MNAPVRSSASLRACAALVGACFVLPACRGATREVPPSPAEVVIVEVTLVADTVAPAAPAFHRDSRFQAERRIEAVVDLASARDTTS